jgi:uncharacterized protein (TIGR02145 family)
MKIDKTILLLVKYLYFFCVLNLCSFMSVSAQYLETPLIPVQKGELYGYIDSISSKIVIPYKYKSANRFIKGLAITTNKKGLRGIINSSGKAVIPHNYRYIGYNRELDIYILDLQGKGMGVLDSGLKQILPLQYDQITFKGKLLMVKRWYNLNGNFDEYFGFYNASGECVVPEELDYEPNETIKGFMGCSSLTKRGLVSMETGKVVVPFIYRKLNICQEDSVVIVSNHAKDAFLYDLKGNQITETPYDDIKCPVAGYYPVKNAEKWGFLKNGVTSPIIYDLGDEQQEIDIDNGTFILTKDKKQGVTEFNGKEIVPFIYDKVSRYSPDYYQVENNGRFGLINIAGKTIIPCEFDKIPYQPGVGDFVLEDNLGNFGAYNEIGELIVPFVVNEEHVLKNYKLAEMHISKLLQIVSTDPKLNYLAALGYYRNKKPQEALVLLNSLIENSGHWSTALPIFSIRSKHYTDLNDYPHAESDARMSNDFTYWGSDAFIYMADKKFKAQDYSQAQSYYTSAGLYYKSEYADSMRLVAIEELKKRGLWNSPSLEIKPEKPMPNLPLTIQNFTADDRMDYVDNYKFKKLFSYSEALSDCPAGYRMPTVKDWLNLIDYVMNEEDISSSKAYLIIYYIGTGWSNTNYEEKVLKTNKLEFKSENKYKLNISPLRSSSSTIELSDFQKRYDVIEYWIEPGMYKGSEVNTIEFGNEGFRFYFKEMGKSCIRYVKKY